MITAYKLADAIGRKKISDTLGVGVTAVSNAVVRGHFPSSWFLAVQALAGDEVDCPPTLFNMREPYGVHRAAQHDQSDNGVA
jgi:hypothetical protein